MFHYYVTTTSFSSIAVSNITWWKYSIVVTRGSSQYLYWSSECDVYCLWFYGMCSSGTIVKSRILFVKLPPWMKHLIFPLFFANHFAQLRPLLWGGCCNTSSQKGAQLWGGITTSARYTMDNFKNLDISLALWGLIGNGEENSNL